MHVLIADSFEQSGIDALTALGIDVTINPQLSGAALAEAVASLQPEVLVVRGTKVSADVLAAGALALVVRAGAGYNTIDVAEASRRGIYVSNCPGKNAIAVAELAFGLILALDRRIVHNALDLREGRWNKAAYSAANGLYGRTLGLVGVGGIGSAMIRIAKGFGMTVVAWSRSLTPERADELGVKALASPEAVAAAADVVSVHVALNDGTRGLCGPAFFGAMKPGALFINTSRGEVVDEDALIAAIDSHGLRAGLDVYADEPAGGSGDYGGVIGKLTDVYGTHHIGASTAQAQEAIAAEAVRVISVFASTGEVPNAVNIAAVTPAVCALVVRHLDRPGVLAACLDAISAAGINVQEMSNTVFEGSEAAVARIALEQRPDAALLAAIREHESVLAASVVEG